MASLDLESLFTNMPLKQTIENWVNYLLFDKSKTDNLRKQDLYELLWAAAKESLLIFDKKFYLQKDGVAVGSSVGPTYQMLFLCNYETRIVHNFVIHFMHGASNYNIHSF